MINVQEIRRNVINVVKNYSDAQVKVRKATSNEPWGPSSTLMGEIADLTYNVVAFSEIMQIIWKRLNDHGKNWRHVYKALVLLEYLIKTGSEKVAQQCRDNFFAIQTLKDFQYFEESKDHGLSIREKSKVLVALLKDEEKLKNERARALKARERFAQSLSCLGSSSSEASDVPRPSSSFHETLSSHAENGSSPSNQNPEIESARPQTVGEEELQLQLALAMSKEEAEQEERLRKNDDLRLKLALEESEKNKAAQGDAKSAVDDLLSLNLGGASNSEPTQLNDPWGVTAPAISNGALFSSTSTSKRTNQDPWEPMPSSQFDDPWSGNVSARPTSTTSNNDPWMLVNEPVVAMVNKPANDPWTSGGSSSAIDFGLKSNDLIDVKQDSLRRTPESFLGPNSNLVNLDALVSSKQQSLATSPSNNPFAQAAATVSNPFQTSKPSQPTINQLRAQSTSSTVGFSSTGSAFSSAPSHSMAFMQTQPPTATASNTSSLIAGGWASFQQSGSNTQSTNPGPSSQQQPHNPFAM